MRLIVYSLLMTVIVFSGKVLAESNESPPDSPFISIGEGEPMPQSVELSDPESEAPMSLSSPSRSGVSKDEEDEVPEVFSRREPVLEYKYQNRTVIPTPTLSWQWHSGGNYTVLAEGKEFLYVVSDQVIHIWDRKTLVDRGQFTLGKPIVHLAVRTISGHEWIIAETYSPPQLLVLDPTVAADGSMTLAVKHKLDVKGKTQFFSDAVVVKEGKSVLRYSLQPDGMLKEMGRVSLESEDEIYPYGDWIYLYRKASKSLELWNSARQELLASLEIGGNPTVLALLSIGDIPDTGSAMLYLLQRQPGNPGLIVGLDKIPVDLKTGRFMGPAETMMLAHPAQTYTLDISKGLLYLRPSDVLVSAHGAREGEAPSGFADLEGATRAPIKDWTAFDLKRSIALSGGWPGALTPYASQDNGMYLVSGGLVRFAELKWSTTESFSLLSRIERRELESASELYLEPSGKRVIFLGKESAAANPSGFQTTFSADGKIDTRRLWSDSSTYTGRIWQELNYWFLENKAGELFYTKSIESGAWQKLSLPYSPDAQGRRVESRHHTIIPSADRTSYAIWVATRYEDQSAMQALRGEIGLYTVKFADPGPVIEGPSYAYADLLDAGDVIPLDTAGRFIAVAAGSEGLVLLQRDAETQTLERIHRRNESLSNIRCERLLLSPNRELLLALFRDERMPAEPLAFVNIYDVREDPKFPLFLDQVTDLSLIPKGDQLELPEVTFARGGQVAAFALGDEGIGMLNLSSPTDAQLTFETIGSASILDIDTASAGEKLCVAAGPSGLYCAKVN